MEHDDFDHEVTMWVFEEMINGTPLTSIINSTHENVKYLPGHKLPENVVAMANVKEAAKDATILVFVIPHQFVKGVCRDLKGIVRSDAKAISLIKV